MKKLLITNDQCRIAARFLVTYLELTDQDVIYGIPRGGIVPAYMVAQVCGGQVTDSKQHATVVVDDVIRTGHTLKRILENWIGGNVPKFGALFSKDDNSTWPFALALPQDQWAVFPWEVSNQDYSRHDIVERMLEAIGEDPTREGLRDTPARVTKAWDEWFSGYGTKPEEFLKTFEDGAEDMDQMIVLPPIPVFSHCEHHLAPFFGTARVAYIPKGHIVGLSKFSKVVDAFSRRLQVQERITTQVANCIHDTLQPLGCGVLIEAQHLCMCSRGIKGPLGRGTVTSALRGCFKDADVKAEFHRLISI